MVARRDVAFSVVFYFDENLLRVASIFAELYPNILYPGHPLCPISTSAVDPDWIRTAGVENWISITRDKRVLRKQIEVEYILEYSARLLLLPSAGQWTNERIVRLLRGIWSDLPEMATRPGPWVYSVTEDIHGEPDPDLWNEEKLREQLASLRRRKS